MVFENAYLTLNRILRICASHTEVRKTGGRSSGSATQTETESAMESGKRSAARGRRSASGDRTKTAGEGESARTLSGRRKGRMRLKRIKSGPLRRRREITLESPVALRGQSGLPKTTRRRRA